MAMKMVDLRFPEEDAVPARIEHRKSLRPFVPVIISTGGGGITLSLLQEKHFDRTLKFSSSIVAVVDDDDDVDTTLGLSNSVSRSSSDSRVYNPMPLRWYIPEGDENLSLGLGPRCSEKGGKAGKRKRDDVVGKKRKRSNSVVNADDQELDVVPSIEEFPKLLQGIESRNGSRPVFLYRKKLEGSDVRGDLNRLFLTKRETLIEFLNAAEAAAVDESTQGLKIVGVDQGGKPYNLGLKKWPSLKMTVINSDWNKLVAANNAEKGDFVEIWGFRENGKLALAITFRK